MTQLFQKATNKLHIFIFFITAIISQSCNPTRMLTSDEYLLYSNELKMDSKAIDKNELKAYYRQSPNTKTFMLFRFRLAVYNFSNLGKERKWKNWVERVIGEEPVIFDSIYVTRTNQQFERFLKNRGYYDTQISSKAVLRNKKAKVTYNIILNEPIVINNVTCTIVDSLLTPLFLSDTSHRLLKKGMLFSLDYMEAERNRMVNQLRDSGYFDFNADYMRFKVDTNKHFADVEITVNNPVNKNADNTISEVPHQKYWINKVYFLPNFDPQLSIRDRSSYFSTFDTISYQGFGFIYSGNRTLKPKVLLRNNSIQQGTLYSNSDVNNTLSYINELRLFRLSNANFFKVPTTDSLINCNISLTPATLQNFSVNFETTNTQGNLGVGGYFNYQHKNIFKGAEILNIKFSGSFQRQSKTDDSPPFNIYETGVEAKLETPSFLLPFKNEQFEKSKHPKTFFSASYNIQQRPDYTRQINNINMGYHWKGTETIHHVVSPIDLSSVDVIPVKENFYDSIQKNYPYLVNNYKDYFIAGGNYSLIYQNKSKSRSQDYRYLRWNVGMAGNLLYILNKLGVNDTVTGGYYEVFNRQYAQYITTDIDHRYYHSFTIQNQFVHRFFAGIAIPYGNAVAIPFVKQYFAGGAQGIRAWRPKDLGPGSYSDSIPTEYPNQMADFKLEMNLEYRFTYSKSWKGAVFLDIGNIWSISKDDTRDKAIFHFNSFYKQLAIGTGFGLRYDLDFAVFRIDWGLPLRDPKYEKAESWVLFHKPLEYTDFVWNIAIGYPF
jgi:outer membrane translocation and assembly module TamA